MKRIVIVEGEDEQLLNRIVDEFQIIVDKITDKHKDYDIELIHFVEQD